MAGALRRRARQRPVRVPRRWCARPSRIDADRRRAGAAAPPRAIPTSPTSPWTEADLALVDEADALLGPVEAARPGDAGAATAAATTLDTAERVIDDLGLRGFADAATLADRFGEPADQRRTTSSIEPRTFGHVLVDEAQDLTAMQWRMLARRCPSGSMTLVGDPGQASKPGAVASWDDVLAHLPHAQRRPASSRSASTTARRRRSWRSRRGCSRSRRRRSSRRARCAAPASTRASSRPRPTTSSTTDREHARAALEPHRRGRGHRAAGAARGDRRRARRRRRGRRRGRRARRADRGARPDRARRASSSTT